MRRLTLTFRILTLVCATMLIFSIAGVSAVWLYTEGGPGEVSVEIPVTMNGEWTGSEILPDEAGNKHQWLIDQLINGEGIGLNTPSSTLNSEIADKWKTGFLDPRYDTIGSMATWFGSELKEQFSTEAGQVEFLIQFVDENNDDKIDFYYIFTVSMDLEYSVSEWGITGVPTVPYGEMLYPVYRTKVEKTTIFEDGSFIWGATQSQLGYADSAKYETTLSWLVTDLPALDPDSWLEYDSKTGSLGTINQPIWTYFDYENTITLVNDATAYYAFYAPQETAISVNSTSENVTLKVYTNNDSNYANAQTALSGTPIATSTTATQADGSIVTTTGNISLTSGRYYYIAVTGNGEITFTINQN